MEFGAARWLWLLLALPVIAALEVYLARFDRDRVARLVARPLWARVVKRPAGAWRWVRLAGLLAGAAGLVLALAQPRWGIVREKVEREGVDVVMVLDTSASMSVDDVQPNRFFLARSALMSLLERLNGDRFALVALEGEAYPLVPLTLDADAVGLFLDTIEPGIVPTPGTSIGGGIVSALDLFVDKARNNKVIVLVSDGEDLEGGIEAAVRKARDMGVVVLTAGVGTERGAPVPEFDAEGRRTGFKKDDAGSAVVSHFNPNTLEEIARATGGQFVRLTSADTSLWQLAGAVERMEQKTLAREYSYRKKERYQVPLGVALVAFTVALLLPLPPLPRRRRSVAVPAAPTASAKILGITGSVVAALLFASGSAAAAGAPSPDPSATVPSPGTSSSSGTQSPSPGDAAAASAGVGSAGAGPARGGGLADELLLRPSRKTSTGRKAFTDGNYPRALESFEEANGSRPSDTRTKFNFADALYKAGKYDEAAAMFQSLAENNASPLAEPSRFNLGNALYQKKDYPGAVKAYRDALALDRGRLETRRNLEMALRAIEEQKKQQQQQQQQNQKDQKNDKQQQQQQSGQGQDKKQQQQQKQQAQDKQQQQQTKEQQEDEKFRRDTGMPKDRAMALLDALQQNEKEQQKKLLEAQRATRKKGKDW